MAERMSDMVLSRVAYELGTDILPPVKDLRALLEEVARARVAEDFERQRADENAADARALEARLNTPEVLDFVRGVQLEAAYQREKWGSVQDAGKTDADWFWLVGYLAGKALHTPPEDADKRRHRLIAAAAALANWHLYTLGKTDMRPGIALLPEGNGA